MSERKPSTKRPFKPREAPFKPREASFKPKAYPSKSPAYKGEVRPFDRKHKSYEEPRTKAPRQAYKTAAAPKVQPDRALSRKTEVKVYGLHASLALFQKRPQDLIRLYCLESMLPRISALTKYCVKNKKAYHVVSSEELEKVTDSIHHEGVCLLTNKPPALSFEELLETLQEDEDPCALIYLEGVENPHNLGSLMRICAHFGVKYLLTDSAQLSDIPSATYRVAKGGVEEVTLVPLKEPLKMLEQLKKRGVTLIASSGHSKTSLYQKALPERVLFMFGSETHGISEIFLKKCKEVLAVPGSGNVESLNVSITSALFLGEFWRQHEHS